MAWTERYVRADAGGAGDGTADNSTDAWTINQAVTNVTGGVRVNVRSGTYALTTTVLTMAVEGTASSRMWWRGFSTTPGDLDSDFTTAKPVLSFTSGHLSVTADYQMLSSLEISGGSTSYNTEAAGVGCQWHRCRFITTNNVRVGINASGQVFSQCYFQAPTTATRVVFLNAGTLVLIGCTVVGGILAVEPLGSSAGHNMLFTTVRGASSHGMSWTGAGWAIVLGNTIAGCGGNGINITNASVTGLCRGNLLVSNTGWGINSTAAIGAILFSHNAFYGNGSGEVTGLGDSPVLYHLTESSDPLVNLAGADLALVSAALSKGAAMGSFENESYSSYLDIGAVQSAAGGGLILPGNLRGNMQ